MDQIDQNVELVNNSNQSTTNEFFTNPQYSFVSELFRNLRLSSFWKDYFIEIVTNVNVVTDYYNNEWIIITINKTLDDLDFRHYRYVLFDVLNNCDDTIDWGINMVNWIVGDDNYHFEICI